MSNQLPAPLTPADCDLRDFAFMPVDIRRLLTSETWITGTGDERAAAMSLWLESWHQVPAGSLPDNDRMLAHLAQCPTWKKSREHVLRGWVKADDGRLYHPVVAEKALEAWLEKLAQRISGAEGNAKRWGMPFDRAPMEAAMQDARQRLIALNPQSRTLSKRRTSGLPKASPPDQKPIAPRSPPDRDPNPGDTSSGSQGTGTGTGTVNTTSKADGAGGEGKGSPEAQPTPPPSPPARHEPFEMSPGWTPSPAFESVAKNAGLTLSTVDGIEASVAEFVAYWLTKPEKRRTQHEWDHALVKSLKADRIHTAAIVAGDPHGHSPRRARAPSATERNARVIADLTGQCRSGSGADRDAIDGTAERVG